MLRLWIHKTKTATVTRNLVLELKYDTVNKKNKVKSKETVGNSWTVLKVILSHKYNNH